jgi:four helix bundle protein
LKEANETIYRLDFLYETNYITKQYMFLKEACEELIKLLVKSIKTSKW